MNFLTSAIVSGVLWDLIKKFKMLTIDKVKSSFKNWALNSSDCELIVNEINSASDEKKNTPINLADYIENNEKIQNIIRSKQNNLSNVTFDNNNIKGNINVGNVNNQKNVFKF